jgi:hypothetical protein
MAKTVDIGDAVRLASSVAAAGGEIPSTLGHLLLAHDLLSSPGAAQPPERDIMTAALKGQLTDEKLAKLLPTAATAAMIANYARELAQNCAHVLLGQIHREIEGGAADQILDSLRPKFDEHAAEIARARSLIDPESSPEHILASAAPEMVEAWQALDGHLRVVCKIAAVASQFGPRLGAFPQIAEYPNADNFRLTDGAHVRRRGQPRT